VHLSHHYPNQVWDRPSGSRGGSQSIFKVALYTNLDYSVLYKKATGFPEKTTAPFFISRRIMFGPSVLHPDSVIGTTMTSADFLAHRKQIYSKTSLGKINTLQLISTESTISVILNPKIKV